MNLPYIAGMTWGWVGVRGTWDTEEARHSMALMKERLALNWTAITFSALQEHPQSTQIDFVKAPTVTDDEIISAVQEARRLNMKVILKPVVNCADGTWRAHINFPDDALTSEPNWDDWFSNYTDFIIHYAKLAEQLKTDMFCIGCEMIAADRREAQWRVLIAKVRDVYSGPITYNCDKYQETKVTWWDAVDIISSSGYYPIDVWERELNRIEAFLAKINKPFFFMEAGCPSREGSEHSPGDWTLQGKTSEALQNRYYEAMLQATKQRDWVRGFVLWDWPAQLYAEEAGPSDRGYCPYGKPAEKTIHSFYTDKLKEEYIQGR